MSPTFLRTWYQMSGTLPLGSVMVFSRLTQIHASPGFDALIRLSRYGVSCSLRSILSITCCSICSALAPGHSTRIGMLRMVQSGMSVWPRFRNATVPVSRIRPIR
jgi:hypothetical protein